MSSPLVPITISSDPADLAKPSAFTFFKARIVSVILSSIVYGFVVLLCFNSLSLLMKTPDTGSRRRRFMLLAYIIIMFLLSTGTLIQEILFVMQGLQPFGEQQWWTVLTSPNNPYTTPFIILGADGFLVWRCLVLYKDIPQAFKILLCVVIVGLASTVGDVGLLLPQARFDGLLLSTLLIAVSTSTCNAIFSTMIVCRILWHNRKIRSLDSEFNHSRYSGLISMFIESAILMVGVSSLYIVSYFTASPVLLTLSVYLLPQISIISTLLIIFRVAQGRAFLYGQSTQEVRSGIRFQNSHQSGVSTV